MKMAVLFSIQNLIITRNLKDFKRSKLPVMTGQQFLETLA